MNRLFIGIVFGFILGATGTYLAVRSGYLQPQQLSFKPAKQIEIVAKISVEEAASDRIDTYADYQTIEQILGLPTDFSQTEALYVVAGRSDSAAVQNLIFQASGITNESDRRGALQILYSRLTELDPDSALALARTGSYANDRRLEASVWAAWARNDIDQALSAALALDSDARRNLAAQAFYAAFGSGGNETIALIEETLRVPPSKNTKAQYLYSLAARSPAEAISYVENQTTRDEQYTLTYWLASYLGRTNPEQAEEFAALFTNPQNRNTYLGAVTVAASEASPETVLEEALSSDDERHRMQAATVLSQLAARDPDKAIAYWEAARNPRERQMFAAMIAQGLAQTDPDRALQWALEVDNGGGMQIYAGVLTMISQRNPERAMDAAIAVRDPAIRSQALQGILMTIANSDPVLAVSYLERVEGTDIEESTMQSILQRWSRTDPEAAIEWALSRSKYDQRHLLGGMGSSLIHQDTQAAIDLLPRLDAETAREWRFQIASILAAQGSTSRAQGFIAQYKGQQDYPRMYAAVVQGMASVDFPAALHMAHALQNGIEKDQLLGALAQRRVSTSPEESVRLLDLISDESVKRSSTQQLVQQWGRRDPEAAATWARNLPGGQKRDSAIVGLTTSWREVTPSRKLLVNSIGDMGQRRQAQTAIIYQLARSDRPAANRLLLEFDFSDAERQQIEKTLPRYNNRSFGIITD